jgi:hypothetical protein
VASSAWKSLPNAVDILAINPFRSPSSSTSSPLLLAVYCASAAAIKLACRMALFTCAGCFACRKARKQSRKCFPVSLGRHVSICAVANGLKLFVAIRVISPMLQHRTRRCIRYPYQTQRI